jgi:hypothetical protein
MKKYKVYFVTFLKDDPELKKVVGMVDQLLSQTTTTSPIMVFPFLRHIIPEASG